MCAKRPTGRDGFARGFRAAYASRRIHAQYTVRPMKLACCALVALSLYAQQRLVSPEVHPDRKVTFRIRAPKAAEVTLTGDWLGTAPAPKLAKDDAGVWSVTLGPFEPSIYIYAFTVDGLAIADPINPRMKLRASTSASLLEVPGDSAFWEPRDVPHGAVEINWQKSKAINGE